MDTLMNAQMILLILGGVLALSAFIVAKKPEAKDLINKLVPAQAIIGVGLLAIGLVLLVQVGPVNPFRMLSLLPLLGIATIGATYGAIVLGFFLGLPLITKNIPSAKDKAEEISKKIAPFSMLFGLVCLGSGAILLLYKLRILKLSFM